MASLQVNRNILKPGSRVSVKWSDEKSFNGKICKQRNNGEQYLVKYDDGDVEWESNQDVNLLSSTADKENTPSQNMISYQAYKSKPCVLMQKPKKEKRGPNTIEDSDECANEDRFSTFLASFPVPLKDKLQRKDNKKRHAKGENVHVERLLFPTEQLLIQMLVGNKYSLNSDFEVSDLEDITAHIALTMLETCTIDCKWKVRENIIIKILNALSVGSGNDAVAATMKWCNENIMTKRFSDDDSEDEEGQYDTDFEDDYGNDSRKIALKKADIVNDSSYTYIQGAGLRNSNNNAFLALRLLEKIHAIFPGAYAKKGAQIRKFSTLETACSVLVKVAASYFFLSDRNRKQYSKKLIAWLYCAKDSISYICRELEQGTKGGVDPNDTNSLLQVLKSTNEPHSLLSCSARLLLYACIIYRIMKLAKHVKSKIAYAFEIAFLPMRELLTCIAYSMQQEFIQISETTKMQHDIKELMGMLEKTPVSPSMCEQLGIPFSAKQKGTWEKFLLLHKKHEALQEFLQDSKNCETCLKAQTDQLFNIMSLDACKFASGNSLWELLELIIVFLIATSHDMTLLGNADVDLSGLHSSEHNQELSEQCQEESKKCKPRLCFYLQRTTSIGVSSRTPDRIPLCLDRRYIIGRASNCDIRLLAKSKGQTQTISRHHALLSVIPRGSESICSIKDTNSANGIFINYTRVKPGDVHELSPGDIVIFGGGGMTKIGARKRFKSEFCFRLEKA